MLEKKMWCAILCLLTFNLSLPSGCWIASAQAAPVTPVVHVVQKSSLATISGDDAFNELIDALSTLFGEDITSENYALELLAPIQDGVAVGVSPSGVLFDIQAASLTNVSQEVLSELEPDQAAEYPCDDFAQTFIGEIHTTSASLPVSALILKTDSCQQTSMMIMGAFSQETYEAMFLLPWDEDEDPYDPPPFSDDLDELTQCPKSVCPELEECYQDCFASFAVLHEDLQGRLLHYQLMASIAKEQRDAAQSNCNNVKTNAVNVAKAVYQAAVAGAEVNRRQAIYNAETVLLDALDDIAVMYAAELIVCLEVVVPPFILRCMAAAAIVNTALIANAYKNFAKAVSRANDKYDAIVLAAGNTYTAAVGAANAAHLICMNQADATYINTVCALYCVFIKPMVDELRIYAGCVQDCYDNLKEACAGSVSVFPDPGNVDPIFKCYPERPSVDARFSWPTLMNDVCPCSP